MGGTGAADGHSRSSRALLLPLGFLILLNLADGLLSHLLVTDAVAREGNPFLQGLVGSDWFVAVKVLGACLCALLLWDISRRHPRLALWASRGFAAGYALIVLWNAALYIAAG